MKVAFQGHQNSTGISGEVGESKSLIGAKEVSQSHLSIRILGVGLYITFLYAEDYYDGDDDDENENENEGRTVNRVTLSTWE